MKRTPLKKIGKTGSANIAARNIIAIIAEEKGLDYCEVDLYECMGNWPLAPAHRHKRAWYRGDVEKLSDYNEWVSACQNCHDQMEISPELTEEVFSRLRPKQENTI